MLRKALRQPAHHSLHDNEFPPYMHSSLILKWHASLQTHHLGFSIILA